jgi:ribonuclease E
MSKHMLINAIHAEESRVAIVENGLLEELGIETAAAEHHKGNIYKGVVVRVEASLQVAFVEYGEKKNGFLPFREIHSSYYKKSATGKRPRIQDVIGKGLEVLVQVVREEREQKGAFMTTYLSIPGRNLVIMPGSDSGGISRKIEDEEERKVLKNILKELKPSEGIGLIVRTAGLGMTKSVLSRELKFLLKIWDQILHKSTEQPAPSLIYRESDLVIRSIRDYFTPEIQEILVDDMDVYKKTLDFFRMIMPRYKTRVKLYQGTKPILSKYNLEEQIEKIYDRKVPLKSGGSIIIEPTEALVSIDVNSGKSMKAKGVEQTAYQTNMEAAEEIIRHLRLRDLGGLIVIDFIDMVNKKNQQEVVKKTKSCLKNDKAKHNVSNISRFGLMEISRQRMHAPVVTGTYVSCEHCSGTGRTRSKESLALIILRNIQMQIAKGGIAAVEGEASVELADFLLNIKREEIMKMEKRHHVRITMYGKPDLLNSQYHLEYVRREEEAPKPEEGSPPKVLAVAASVSNNGVEKTEPPKEKKRTRRPRRRKNPKASPEQEK